MWHRRVIHFSCIRGTSLKKGQKRSNSLKLQTVYIIIVFFIFVVNYNNLPMLL